MVCYWEVIVIRLAAVPSPSSGRNKGAFVL